jgi:hypothetical protein
MMIRQMNCEQVSDALQDYLENDAPAPVRTAIEAHALSCGGCAALLSELTEISVEASQLPALSPSRDLWSGIAERIDAPVVSIDSRRGIAAAHDIPKRPIWLRPGIAAAALVMVTAGTTHVITRSMLGNAAAAGVVATEGRTSAPANWSDRIPGSRIPTEADLASRGNAGDLQVDDIDRDGNGTISDPRGTSQPRFASSRGGESAPPEVVSIPAEALLASFVRPSDAAYDDEVGRLRTVLAERRTDLDSSTVAIVEKNLGIIEQAIQESRSALARDPASLYLNEQLNYVLEKKIELLRAAAALPSRS